MSDRINLMEDIHKELAGLDDGPEKELITKQVDELNNIKIPAVAAPVEAAIGTTEGLWESDDHSFIASSVKDVYHGCQRVKNGIVHQYNTDTGYWHPLEKGRFRAEVYNFCKKHYNGRVLSKNVVDSVYDLSLMELICEPDMFEQQDENVIVFSNCEIHRDDNGEWRREEHDSKKYRISGIQAEYDPDAECPEFLKFMDQTFANTKNPETLKQRVLELMGMTLISSNHDAQIIFLDGIGRNGKGTLQTVMENILGAKACATVPPDKFDKDCNIASIYGKLMVSCGDVQAGTFLNDGSFKQISGGDTLMGRHLYGDPFFFKASATIWMAGNNGLRTKDTSHAMMARMNIIPFVNVITEDMKDEMLSHKLKEEVPGIVNVILKAYSDKCKRGKFTVSEDINKSKDEWKTDNSIFIEFAKEMIGYREGSTVLHSTVYHAFKQWCEDNGYKKIPIKKLFREELRHIVMDQGITVDDKSGRTFKWRNIKILEPFEDNEFSLTNTTVVDGFEETSLF